MITLAIASQKGGVGKTTLAVNLAYALSQRGWRTLLVDADPQGWVGLSLGRRGGAGVGLLEVLAGGAHLADAYLETRVPGLHILTAGSETARVDVARTESCLAEEEALGRLLAQARSSYDLAIFDTPSGLRGPTLAALRTADYILVPVPAEPLAARSITQTLDALAALRDQGSQNQLAGFVLNMVDWRNDLSVSVAREARRSLPPESVFSVVPHDPIFLQASAHGLPLALLGGRPPAVASVFEQLATELEQRLRLGVAGARPHGEPEILKDSA